jgi:formylglycine-generating enzyme required for sulfatase activity
MAWCRNAVGDGLLVLEIMTDPRLDFAQREKSPLAPAGAAARRRGGPATRLLGAALILIACVGVTGSSESQSLPPSPLRLAQAAPAAPEPAGAEFVQGDNWALIIGINEYPNLPPGKQLLAAKPGAEGIVRVLRNRYGFAREQIKTLYDGQATRGGIVRQLRDLRQTAGENDSVIVYFGGHCQADPGSKDVWWLPSDAQEDDVTSLLSLNDLPAILGGIPARHIYLIADSCIADDMVGVSRIAGSPTVREAYQKRSRWVLSSGTIFPAPEGGQRRAVPSVFTAALLKELDGSQDAYLTPMHLVTLFTKQLPAAAIQSLKNGPIAGAGDDGGQFIFRLEGATPPAAEIRVPSLEDPRLASLRQQVEATKQLGGLPEEIRNQAVAALQGKIDGIEKEIQAKKDAEARRLEEQRQAGLRAQQAQQGGTVVEARLTRPAVPPPTIAPPKPEDLTPMVPIPAGEFVMGSGPRDGLADETPQKRITLDAYSLDKFETTVGRYARFLQASGADSPEYWNLVSLENDAELPVVGVDWDQAQAYCKWAGKRLPTEAEWEKAARGTDGRKHPWGNEGPTPQVANFGKGGTFGYSKSLSKVGSYESGKSPYGVYDMIGNVWEWVADWYDKGYYQNAPEKNPKGPEKGEFRVIRGGSWAKVPLVVRAAGRNRAASSSQTTSIGFRCAKDGS